MYFPSGVIFYVTDTCLAGAVGAAVKGLIRLDPVSDDLAAAVIADRGEFVDCTLETVKSVTFSAYDHFKRLVIIVPANFAFSHTQFVRAREGSRRCQI